MNEIFRIFVRAIDIRNSTIEKHMNHLWTIYFHDLIVFVNSQDRISKEIMSTLTFQAFFISFLLLVFLIETSGNSISFLAVIIVDVLLVYFNYDKCYNNECIYYEHSHCITFFRRCSYQFYLLSKSKLPY